ncbi:hypothetical protein [Chryseobacterium sp.]|uniref:hypothetical protein n=1 Tax=Chryseobacterium sp. TaxID=1871047 RepID=UPI0025BCBBD6|nr:hypothetical protein [Chryseobacterium sp.]MBV8326609.1 hypothetical protein [Chryseobacterium sp.]
MNNTGKIEKEIKDFHENIERWFQGKAENQENLYSRLLSGFSPDFKMLNGNGDIVTLSMLAEWLPSAYGKFPDRKINLDNIEILHSENHGLATYTEIQITEATSTKRKSSALFLLDEEKALWFHLIEKWI